MSEEESEQPLPLQESPYFRKCLVDLVTDPEERERLMKAIRFGVTVKQMYRKVGSALPLDLPVYAMETVPTPKTPKLVCYFCNTGKKLILMRLAAVE